MPEPNDGKHRVRLKSGFGCKKAAVKEEGSDRFLSDDKRWEQLA